MAEIYKFDNNEEQCECPFCQLAHEFMTYIKDCENDEELFDILRGLVGEASKLSLIDFMQQEIETNVEMINHLVSDCEE